MALPSLFRSPDSYLGSMIDRIRLRGSKLTDFMIGSTTRTFYEGLAVAFSEQTGVIDQHRRDAYLSTATGDALTLKALDLRVRRKSPQKATGQVRITRTDTTTAITIPAGWGPLAIPPSPGVASQTYLTTQDAVLAIGVGAATVNAVAENAGVLGNLSLAPGASRIVLPINPVPTFKTDGDFFAFGPFVGGLDEESDDALRARVPIEVQGRVKGRKEAFLAAALRVPAVSSAQVLQPTDLLPGGGSVLPGHVQVYYEALTDVAAQVTSEVLAAGMLGQTVDVTTAVNAPIAIALTLFCEAGIDTVALQADAKTAIINTVLAAGVGDGRRISQVVRAVHELNDVIGIDLPPAQFRLKTSAPGTATDIAGANGKLLTLAGADLTVTVTVLP